MRCSRKYSALLIGVALCLGLPRAEAEGITVTRAQISAGEDGGEYLEADFDLELTGVLESALNRGVVLTFDVDLALIQPRWYWFNKEVISFRQVRRLSFNPLSRTYRFSLGSLYLTFNTLHDALQALSRINHARIGESAAVKHGEHYVGELQIRMDVSQLPKPFQVDALANGEWNLASSPYTWNPVP